MTETIQGNADAGECWSILTLPTEWPPRRNGIIIEHRLSGGSLLLVVDVDGRFHLSLTRDDPGGPIIVTTSGIPVRGAPNSRLVMRLRWSLEGVEVELNGVVVAASDDSRELPQEYVLPERSASAEFDDFSKKNAKAIRKRRQRYGAHKPDMGRIYIGPEYLLDSLKAEMLQMSDLLEHLKAGRLHHVGGLASRLRLLVSTGKPLPLLQSCAAILDLPLIVHTVRLPRLRLPPAIPTISYSSLELSYSPNESCQNPIDLDEWLQLPCGQVGAVAFSYGQLMMDLGNTIGSHIDPELLPTVVMLRSTYTGLGQIRFDQSVRFLWKLAEELLPLCRDVLVTYEQRGGAASLTAIKAT